MPACAALAAAAAAAAPAVPAGLRSFGTAVKESKLIQNQEKTVFEYNLSAGATHGVVTQQWHAGKPSGTTPDLRVRMYIDGEAVASVDYPLFLAHGAGPAQRELAGGASGLAPWASALFGRTHDSGWYNTFLIPFRRSVRVTLTDPASASRFWYMVRGLENYPLVVSGLTLPPSARLQLARVRDPAVRAGTLVTFANVSGTAGLLRQLNLVVNSSTYKYQEGCVSALVDGGTANPNPIFISSGLEDYFLGAYFHSMPTMHLPYAGFQLNATPDTEQVGTNSLAAYRIHEHDPIVFSESLLFRWIAESDNKDEDGNWCNFHWPEKPMPTTPPPNPPADAPLIRVDALAWVYTWD